jgi:hypothetical protein
MDGGRSKAIWVLSMGALCAVSTLLVVSTQGRPVSIKGAVVQWDADPRKQSPIADVDISAANGMSDDDAKSDASGFFSIPLRSGIQQGQPVKLLFRHPDFHPLELNANAGDRIYVVRMAPQHTGPQAALSPPEEVITNVFVRYSIGTTSGEIVGSGVKTFEVVNTGNVRCNGSPPCSPDGKWKAAVGTASLDAGEGNEFRNARIWCIAGPCPFTKADSNSFSKPGRIITVSVRNWSDTATFMIQAEVFHTEIGDTIRRSFPVILGRVLNFIVPPQAEGPSIEAEINGSVIVFPLGPDPVLSWADCDVRVDKDQAKLYRCELKPGYRFR